MNQKQRDDMLEQMLCKHLSKSNQILDVASKLAVPAVLGLVGWMWIHEGMLNRHESRLAVIEDNRFTPVDASLMKQQLYREFVEKFDTLNRQMATVVANLEALNQRLERER